MKTARTAALLTLMITTPLLASEAKIPIYQGTTTMTPGHYIMTRDFAPPIGPGGSALTIMADGVTVDMNGHRIGGQAPVHVEESIGLRNSLHGDPTLNGNNHGIYVDALSSDALIGHKAHQKGRLP